MSFQLTDTVTDGNSSSYPIVVSKDKRTLGRYQLGTIAVSSQEDVDTPKFDINEVYTQVNETEVIDGDIISDLISRHKKLSGNFIRGSKENRSTYKFNKKIT